MFNITLLVVGKIKEHHFQDAFDEYAKRLKPYCRLNIVELKSEPFSGNDKEKAKKIEGERICKFLTDNKQSKIFILDERGVSFTSVGFAEAIKSISEHIIFVIGGSLGYSEEVLRHPAQRISLSNMTFPHELVRVILIEQLYRAVTIINGKEYHY